MADNTNPTPDDTSESSVIQVKVQPKAEPTTAPTLTKPVTAAPEPPVAVEEAPVTEEPKATELADDEVDPETEKALDDMYAHKDDELTTEDETPPPEKPVKRKRRLFGWWHSPLKRRLVLGVLFVLIAAGFVWPKSRYFVLNNTGVRSSVSLVVQDDSTQQPLKNVEVELADQKVITDINGRASFYNLRLGPAKLVIHKRAFAQTEKSIVVGWGSNRLNPVALKPVGSQYQFAITDYLSGKPIAKAEAITGESSALSDEQGSIKLTLDITDENQTAQVTVRADGYRSEAVTLDLDNQGQLKLQLVPAQKHVYISKRSGRYDVYRADVDGKNEEKVLAGSGIEKDDLVLVQHPSKDYAVLVSTRENVRDSDGALLSTLTLIDTKNKTATKVAQSQRVQVINWIGDKLIFVQIAKGAAADDPQRHRLVSYDLSSGESKELASANFFNDVLIVGDSIFYAPSAAYTDTPTSFYKIAADGSNKQTVLDKEVWNIFRTEYDKLVLAVGQDWYDYQISSNKVNHLSGEPSDITSRVYVMSPDHKTSLWVDQRDGKGVLLAYDVNAKTDKVIYSQAGLSTPVQWLGNGAVTFRINASGETADYALSLNGGEPKKIKDVTNTAGIDRWYYY